ncbi:MAG TPA: hypothetical protein DCW90_10000 [Lachnospiraceae bacterium]|nr:hypothetical protein [Lachnospiraceae bacterium]
MNKRQKKKLEAKLLVRIKKLHPGKNDIILMEFNSDKLDFYSAMKYFHALADVYNKITFALMPDVVTLKQLAKDDVLEYINRIKEVIENE